jgi:hypothetical protein
MDVEEREEHNGRLFSNVPLSPTKSLTHAHAHADVPFEFIILEHEDNSRASHAQG